MLHFRDTDFISGYQHEILHYPTKQPWLRGRLKGTGLRLPKEPPHKGFIGQSKKFGTRVGVWLMPDNRRSGSIEHFLRGLIAENDLLIRFAETSTARAKRKGATFKEQDQLRAQICTWLAWQESPGLTYGTAITAKYFGRDRPAALAFVEWFRKLYRLGPPLPGDAALAENGG